MQSLGPRSWPRACAALRILVPVALVAAMPAQAALSPADLAASEAARRQAVAGDLLQAQAAWDVLLARAGAGHSVRVAAPCAGLREALVARRDLAPLFVRTLPSGCHEVLWGHFASADEARVASGRIPERLTEGRPEVVPLAAPLAYASELPPVTPVVVAPVVVAPVVVAPVVVAPPEQEPLPVAATEPEPQPEAPAPAIAAVPPAPIAEEPRARPAALEGETAASLFQRGNVAYAEGDLDAAIEAFEAALSLEPDNPRALNNLGATWLLKGDAARAATLAKKALDLDPAYARAALNLGTALYALERSEEALPHLQRAVELDPGNVDALHNLAALLAEMRRFTEAERLLLDALALAPGDARLVRQLEQVQSQLGVRTAVPLPAARQPAPAVVAPIPAATEPVAPAPGGPCSKPLSAGARSRLAAQMFADGREAYGRGDMEASEAILERALECDPESAPILNHLGAARLQAGNAAGAASAFTLALQFQPDFVEASVNLALALLAQGRCEDSTSRLGGLRTQHPDSGEAAYQHARALLRCGRASEALTAIEGAERLLPADPRVSRLRERLQQQELR